MDWNILQGDVIDKLKTLPDNSVNAIITDPPYNLGMDKWDKWPSNKDFGAWCKNWATEAYRTLTPGGAILSFGATKTYHHMAMAIEDSGFIPRDLIEWVYWSTMPKNSSLKSCHEPIFYGVKPPIKDIVINIDDCRVPLSFNKGDTEHMLIPRIPTGRHPGRSAYGGDTTAKKFKKALDNKPYKMNENGRHPYNIITTDMANTIVDIPNIMDIKKPRGEDVSSHPTQKPVSLMLWLISLVTKPDDIILDCFAGSGTTAVAALMLKRNIILIEQNPEFVDIIKSRLQHTI
ncbi:MAG: DNA-methyltransferase [Nitrososphaeraceae archaeon]